MGFNAIDAIKGYVDKSNWEVHENSNKGFAFPSLLNHVAGMAMKEYAMTEMYTKEIAEAHKTGFIHIHDLGTAINPYCCGWDVVDLLLKGFRGSAKATAAPAKHLDSFLAQVANFIGTLQSEWAGAQAFNSIDVFSAPFIRHDNLSYAAVKQAIQRFIFWLNIATRGGESAFSNITLDMSVPEDYQEMDVIIGGEPREDLGTYADYQREIDIFNEAFVEIMMEGDSDGKPFSFPVTTINVTDDFPWDSPVTQKMFVGTARYGLFNFQNYIGSGLDIKDVRSLCCRLSLSFDEIKKRTGGIFGNSPKTGSIGVVTLNLAMLANEADGDLSKLLKLVDNYCNIAKESLEIKRKVIQNTFDSGLLPYTKMYLSGFQTYFSTIGVVGGNECCEAFLGEGIQTDVGQELMTVILKRMLSWTKEYSEETGNMYNLESTPAEGCSFRLALCLRERFPNAPVAGEGDGIYLTNSTNLPVDFSDDLWKCIQHQEPLQNIYSGGTIFHVWLGESPSPETAKALVRTICQNSTLPFFSLTPTFSLCPKHGYIPGEHETCPICVKENDNG